ncbi:MAG TPA: hypothetical protein VMU68_05580 [Acidimicrobiales bacterium]|nr:hypothetical protein [Acidimicrobiales bacterium]
MKLTLDSAKFLSSKEQAHLAKTLGWAPPEVSNKLTGILKAAFSDYTEMLLGSPLPSRADEIREKRLLHLLRHYAKAGELLTEIQICAMFQLNESEARRLLRGVRSRFRSELDDRVATSVVALLQSAKKQNDGNFRVQLTSDNLLDALKMAVTVNAPQLDQIIRVRGAAGLYDIPPDTYGELCKEFNATPVP